MNEDDNLKRIFNGLFRPLFELKSEMSLDELRRCFPRTKTDALTSFMVDFHRLELVTLTAPYRWRCAP